MQKCHFITFGNQRYYNSVTRICQEAQILGVFNTIKGYREKDLFEFEDFLQHRDYCYNNRRGFGYWTWKSFLVMKNLETMDENDILADAGCTINKEGRERMLEYFKMANESHTGNVAIQLQPEYTEKMWTKMDLVEHLQAHSYMDSIHTITGFFVIRKCDFTLNLVREWYKVSCNYDLVNDSPSRLPNYPEFVEHRHDQSVFSLLRKKYGCVLIEEDETYNSFIPDPYADKTKPVHATRISG